MDPNTLHITSSIEELTICLQLCKKLRLKRPPELILHFSCIDDKRHIESRLNSFPNNPHMDLNSTTSQLPTSNQNEDVNSFQTQTEARTNPFSFKEEMIAPNKNDSDHDIEETKTPHSSKDHSSGSTHSSKSSDDLGVAKAQISANQFEKMKINQTEANDNEGPDLIELEKSAYELTLQQKTSPVRSKRDSSQTNGQKTMARLIQGDPIKLKFVQIRMNDPKIKGLADRYSCILDFDSRNSKDLRVKGLEKNVKAFEEAFYRYLDSISWVQLGRTLEVEEYYLLLKCKSLMKVMNDNHVRLIRFDHDSNRVVELNKYETIGYLIGERQDSLEYVKRYISEFYPKKIVLYQLQKHALCSTVCNEAIEEYLKLIHLTSISENFNKFNQGLESDLLVKETRDFYEYYIITSTARASSKEIQYVIGKKAQELFMLNFTVQPGSQKVTYDDHFWKMYDEFSRRLLTMGFVMKCKIRHGREGLLFSLMGKSTDFNTKYCPWLFEAPIFSEKTSEASLILRTDPYCETSDGLLPQNRVLSVKMESKKLYVKFDSTGDTKEILETMSKICGAHIRLLKSNANLNAPSENGLNICTKTRGKSEISTIFLNPFKSSPSKEPELQSINSSEGPNQNEYHPTKENSEKSETLYNQFPFPTYVGLADEKNKREKAKNDFIAQNLTKGTFPVFRQIELLNESPKKLTASSDEALAVKKLLIEKFGVEDTPIIAFKFSSSKLWYHYSQTRSKWANSLETTKNTEALESEFVAEVALEQEELEKYCSSHTEFNKAISLRDAVSKKDLKEQPICIKSKYYHVLTMFLVFLPFSKKDGACYQLTEPNAVYPLYSILLPV